MAWQDNRIGYITGSNAKLIASTGEMNKKYRNKIACERILGRSLDVDISHLEDIARGNDDEKLARLSFESKTALMIEEVGFIISEKYEGVGCSIDGFIDGRKGIVEIKCPKPENHIKYLLANKLPCDHKDQCFHNTLCAEAEYCAFVSYCKEFKPYGLDTFIHIFRAKDNEEKINIYEEKLINFSKEVNETVEYLKSYNQDLGALL